MSRGARGPGGRLEFQRENLWVGIFVLLAAVLFAVVATFALQQRLFRRDYSLSTSFPRIEGLRPGAEVFLRGYAVGRVERIRYADDPEIRFDVEFTVEEAIRLPAGTRARLSTRGFANKVLDLVTPGDPTEPDAPPPRAGTGAAWLAAGDRLPGVAGADIDALLSDGVALTRRLASALQRLDTLLDERVGPGLEILIRSATADLDAMAADLRATTRDARDAIRQADALVTESRPKLAQALDLAGENLQAGGDLVRRLDALLASMETRIDTISKDLASALERADRVLGKVDAAVSEEELKAALADVASAAERADLLMQELQKRPWRLMRRVKGEKEALLEEMEAREKTAPDPNGAP